MALPQANTVSHSVSRLLKDGQPLSVTSHPEKKVSSFITWLWLSKECRKINKLNSPDKSPSDKPEWSRAKIKHRLDKSPVVVVWAKVFPALTFILKRMDTCLENSSRWLFKSIIPIVMPTSKSLMSVSTKQSPWDQVDLPLQMVALFLENKSMVFLLKWQKLYFFV